MNYSSSSLNTSQASFNPSFSLYKSGTTHSRRLSTRDQVFLQQIKSAILAKLDHDDLNVHHLCRTVFLSHTQVYRKIKALTGLTPTLLIRSVRLQKGKDLLATTNWSICDIAYEIGFTDPNYFSRAFQQEFHCTPSSVRQAA